MIRLLCFRVHPVVALLHPTQSFYFIWPIDIVFKGSRPDANSKQLASRRSREVCICYSYCFEGAEVVRMYKTLPGSQGFRKNMDLYLRRHDGQAVTCEDFYSAMRDANDADIANFLLCQ